MTPSFATQSRCARRLAHGLARAASRRSRSFLPSTSCSTATRRRSSSLAARAPRQREAGRRLRRRVLARQVRADQRDLLRRHRPPHPAGDAGTHDDVPGRARLGRGRGGRRLSLLPIETRLEGPVARRAARASRAPGGAFRSTSTIPSSSRESLQEVTRTEWVTRGPGARARLLGRRGTRRQPAVRRRGPGRGAGLAPRADQLPASAAQAGPGRARHAGPQRDRRRARADARPAADRARHGLHPRRRHRRHALRPRRSGATTSARTRRRASSCSTRSMRSTIRSPRPRRSQAQIARSSSDTARTLDVATERVFPLSARAGARRARRRRRAGAAREPPARARGSARRAAAAAAPRRCSSRSCSKATQQIERRSRAASATGAASSPSRCSSCAACAARAAARCALMLERVDAETAEFEAVHDAAAGAARRCTAGCSRTLLSTCRRTACATRSPRCRRR